MHRAKNMVGSMSANFNAPLWKRYFHLSKHRKPGTILKSLIGFVVAAEIKVGVVVYA